MLEILFRDELNKGAQSLADMTVFWIGEPDHSSHEIGLKSELTERARTHADKLFGRIYDWWIKEGRNQNVQLVTMSDHGHGEIAGHVDLRQFFGKPVERSSPIKKFWKGPMRTKLKWFGRGLHCRPLG